MLLKLLTALAVWLLLDWALRNAFGRLTRIPEIARHRILLLERFARAILLLFAVFISAAILGYAPHDLWTAISTLFALIGIGLVAFWSVLSSIVCGVILMLSQPFHIGDVVEIYDPSAGDKPGTRGTVVEFTALYVVLQDSADVHQKIFIPHNLVMQRAIRVFKK